MINLENWRKKLGFKTATEKLKIYFSVESFAKIIQLIKYYPVEIGWNMIVKPFNDGYRVSDVLVYPQKISSAYISVDNARWGLWKSKLDDETEANLYGHGHSHVNFEVFSSTVDERQQYEEIAMKGKGFYLFQIWNKKNEINSFFYDVNNKIFYPEEKIEIIVEDADKFVEETSDNVNADIVRLMLNEEDEDFESE